LCIAPLSFFFFFWQMSAALMSMPDTDGDISMTRLRDEMIPGTPDSRVSTGSVDSDDRNVYMHPDSPQKMLKPETEVAAEKYEISDGDVTLLVRNSEFGFQGSENKIVDAILYLVREQKVPREDPKVVKLCRRLAESIVLHVYGKPHRVRVTEMLSSRCEDCKRTPTPYSVYDPNVCIEQLAYDALPTEVALLVADLKHSIVLTHLLIELRVNGALPQPMLDRLSSQGLSKVSVWSAMNIGEAGTPSEADQPRHKRAKGTSK
jgi:hypothetical protein